LDPADGEGSKALNCPSCGTANQPGQRFCGECGTKLAATCPNCSAPIQPGQRFCGECGTKVEGAAATQPAPASGSASARPEPPPAPFSSARELATLAGDRPGAGGIAGADGAAAAGRGPGGSGAPVAERRLVTILFADLVGFTPFAEERDSEDVRETLTKYFDVASEIIGRYGGTIEKFIGDAVMAVWGTPTTREDDAERAVRAAMELVEGITGLGAGIQVRAGVLTGETAVTLGATNQGMVAGDIVNTAARIQAAAPPGTVLVGESTFRAASAAIAFEEAGEQTLKGKSAPVAVWRALRVVAEVGGRKRSDSLEAPFVGRDDELRLLKELFHGTTRDSRTRLVSVTGIAGIGKSRLAWEFEKYLDGVLQRVWWHHGRSPAYDQGLTFWPLGEMIRGRAGLAELDDDATTRTKIAEAVATHVTEPAEQRWIEAALLALLGVERAMIDGRPASPEELFAAWRTFIERMAETGPVVMVFEDLHWADVGTLDFIDHLLDWAKSIPLLIVTLARPELLERRPTWGAGRRNFVGISLEPLSEPDLRALLTGLVPGLPEAALRTIVQRADGIPLYAVETIRTLVADRRLEERDGVYVPTGDLTELGIPDTLTALIAARLDGLDPADRSLLLDAAVLGQSFTPAGLAAISGTSVADLEPRLRVLVRNEILVPALDPRSPERGQYAFVQALIREVAYNTLSKRDRKDRHLAAARFFESIGSEELASALAGHYLAAHELASPGPEADALAAQARIALRVAAERAATLGSPAQAARFFEQLLAVTTSVADQVEALERAGVLASTASQHVEAIAHLGRALELAETTGDPLLVLREKGIYARLLIQGKRMAQAAAILDVDSVPEALRTSREFVAFAGQQARLEYLGEHPREAIAMADRILELAEHGDHVDVLADLLVTKGSALNILGRTREGTGVIQAGRALAESAGLTAVILRALNNLSTSQSVTDLRAGYNTLSEGMAFARRLGDRNWVLSFTSNLGFSGFMVGEWDTAQAELEAALADAEDPADRGQLIDNLLSFRYSRGEDGKALHDELVAINEAAPDMGYGALVKDVDAFERFTAGDFRTAAGLFREMAHAASGGAQVPLVLATRSALMLRDAPLAREVLAEVTAGGFHGPSIHAWVTELTAGIDALEGRRAEAHVGFREALRFYRSVRQTLDEAMIALTMLRTLGSDDVDARNAEVGARAIFESLRATAFVAHLDACIAGPVKRSRATADSPAPTSGS
jgi:class 3 adenylate cyclase/tetratricopeptide (TPR) repeat protein/predicted nucleic acid-binding Zn ribbon protein